MNRKARKQAAKMFRLERTTRKKLAGYKGKPTRYR